jgi:hypothetical protein
MERSAVDRLADHAKIKRWVWMGSILCWPVGLVIFMVGFMVVAGFVPPPSPSWSAERVTEFYAANTTSIRVGLLMTLFGSGIALLPFFTVVSAEIRKIEGRPAVLAPMQMGGAVALVLIFQVIGLLWLLGTYRLDRAPDVTQAMMDYGWFAWSTFIITYEVQWIALAIASFMDVRDRPVWPRWAAYVFLWTALAGPGGMCAVFVKHGPLAWNGLVGFWIPAIAFVIGMSVVAWCMWTHARHEEIAGVEKTADDLQLELATAGRLG